MGQVAKKTPRLRLQKYENYKVLQQIIRLDVLSHPETVKNVMRMSTSRQPACRLAKMSIGRAEPANM